MSNLTFRFILQNAAHEAAGEVLKAVRAMSINQLFGMGLTNPYGTVSGLIERVLFDKFAKEIGFDPKALADLAPSEEVEAVA